jgi:hypothetical protein
MEAKAKAEARVKITKVLKSARLSKSDSYAVGLDKLKKAMTEVYGKNFDVKTEPLGVLLAEKVDVKAPPTWTATGSATCTFPPMSCHFDPDG